MQRDSGLLIVAAKQSGRLYVLERGEIQQAETVMIDAPRYSDREGFFMRRGGGMTFGSGAVYENQKEYVQHQFVKELALHLRAFTRGVEHVYLLVPRYEAPLIKAVIPLPLRRKIIQECYGNFVNTAPRDLVAMLERQWQQRRAEAVEHVPVGEARKLWYRRVNGLSS